MNEEDMQKDENKREGKDEKDDKRKAQGEENSIYKVGSRGGKKRK